MTQDVLETGTPRIAEHTLEYADDLRTNIGLATRVAHFKRVEGYRVSSVGRVEINNIVNAAFGNEAKVVNRKVAVGVDDAITLVIKHIGECKEFKHTRFAGASLANDINVTRTVASQHAELVVDATEVGQTKGRNIFVVGRVASNQW